MVREGLLRFHTTMPSVRHELGTKLIPGVDFKSCETWRPISNTLKLSSKPLEVQYQEVGDTLAMHHDTVA